MYDVEVVARRWALGNPAISAVVGNRVATSLPADPIFPFLVVVRVGGAPLAGRDYLEDQAQIQWDCYGAKGDNKPDWAAASEAARTLVQEAHNFQGKVNMSDGGYAKIDGMQVTGGPRRFPEIDTGWARYVVDMIVYVTSEV